MEQDFEFDKIDKAIQKLFEDFLKPLPNEEKERLADLYGRSVV